jgi:universal stress protein A
MKFNRILCGVDFSQPSVIAFDAAVELARLFKAELHIIHVIEAYPVVKEWLPVEGMDEIATSLEEKATAAMEALVSTAKKVFNGTPVTTEVTRGRASVEILSRARGLEADLIVLGAIGLTLIEEAFTGNTAQRVMKEAKCSVLIVRG